MTYYTHAETMPSTVYVLCAADKSMFKIGRSQFLANRVSGLCRQFDFNLEASVCFHFKDKEHALIAERELKAAVRGWEVIFDEPFPGHTEYYIDAGYFEIVCAIARKGLTGLIAAMPIVDSLSLEDYDPPVAPYKTPQRRH